jgi:hypothetical protein
METNNTNIEAVQNEIDALYEETFVLESGIIQIESQLTEAKANQRDSNVYADAEWFRKANTALKSKNLQKRRKNYQINKFQTVLSKLVKEKNVQENKKEQLERGKRYERCFIKVVKGHLPSDAYEELVIKAQKMLEELESEQV